MRRFFVVLTTFGCLSLSGFAAADNDERVWLDVRTQAEYDQGHLERAVHIPHTEVAEQIADKDIARDDDIYVYCRTGRRAEIAREALQELGFQSVVNVGSLEEARAQVEDDD